MAASNFVVPVVGASAALVFSVSTIETRPVPVAGHASIQTVYAVDVASDAAAVSSSTSSAPENARAYFNRLVTAHKEAAAFLSSTHERIRLPQFRLIVALGAMAVPWLLEEIRIAPLDWPEALAQITGEDPVREADWGDDRAIVASWIEWAAQRDAT